MTITFLILILTISSAQATIFNIDDRTDIELVNSSKIKEMARSIPTLVQKRFLKSIDEDRFEIISRSYQEDLDFCEDEKFVKNQSLLANGSAFLVGTDTIGTAAHCISLGLDVGLKDYAVAF
jgi:hypothetical protein